jgi:hypothetical protein
MGVINVNENGQRLETFIFRLFQLRRGTERKHEPHFVAFLIAACPKYKTLTKSPHSVLEVKCLERYKKS